MSTDEVTVVDSPVDTEPPVGRLGRLLREPLLHFLLIGAGLFLVFGQVNDSSSPEAGELRIVVSAGRIEQLSSLFAKTWQRPPSEKELQGLIDEFVLEEIYYRQAKAMGIDRDDTVIRRRLRQKLEFLTDDIAAAVEPTEDELAAYLEANPGAFRRAAAYTFQQVYVNPERPKLKGFLAKELAALQAGKPPQGNGLIPAAFEREPRRRVDGTFGTGFSTKLDELALGTWHGPIESGLGLHLVRVDVRVPGARPKLAEVRALVEREWRYARKLETKRLTNEKLREQYEVIVERPTKTAAKTVTKTR